MSDRLSSIIEKMWKRVEEKQWVYGKLGRLNQDSTYTFNVPGRDTFLYVTMRTASGGQTIVAARNDAGVPHAPRLNVKMKLEQGIYVIHGKTGRQDLGLNPAVPDSGVEVHNHDDLYFRETEHLDVSAGVADAGKPIKLNVDGLVDESMLTPYDWQDEIDTAAEQTVLEDTNNFGLTDTAVTKRVTWSTIWNAILDIADLLYAPITKGVTNGDIHDHSGGDGAQIAHGNLSGVGSNSHATIDSHLANTSNPHSVTKTQVGLGNVDNTSDATKNSAAVTLTNKTLDSTNISSLTAKDPPVDADSVVIVDSAASNVFKRVTWANIKAALTTVFNSLYVALTGNQSIAGDKTFSGVTKFDGNVNLSSGTQDYLYDGDGTSLWLQGQSAGAGYDYRLATFDGDGTDNIVFSVWGIGKPGQTTNRERLLIMYNAAGPNFLIFTEGAGTGVVRAIILASGDGSLQIHNDGVRITQATLGSEVLRLTSTATNDDPTDQWFHGRVATTNNTTTTIATIAIPASTCVTIEADFLGHRTGGTAGSANDSGGHYLKKTYKNNGGVVTLVANLADTGVFDNGVVGVTATISGTNVLLQVVGDTNNNYTWHVHYRVKMVNT